jgi:hypothetical protein
MPTETEAATKEKTIEETPEPELEPVMKFMPVV